MNQSLLISVTSGTAGPALAYVLRRCWALLHRNVRVIVLVGRKAREQGHDSRTDSPPSEPDSTTRSRDLVTNPPGTEHEPADP
jgi:siroheme synthase (precorrin-2 oxidase/ferrochelatase)